MTDCIKITLPDGSQKEYARGTTPHQIASDLSRRLGKQAVAARVDGRLVGLNTPVDKDASLEILTFDSEEARDVYRHTAAHVLAQAVKRLYPGTKFAIGPAIDDGFYYDFEPSSPFSAEDLEKIEAEMKRIIAEAVKIHRKEVSRDEALELFKDEPYKQELIRDLPEDERISVYTQAEFADLCAGPHLPDTSRLKAVKVLNSAGAYWRGDERRPMLQRIYGTAFDDRAELEKYLSRIEEAKRRDHRRLGKELGLFSVQEECGAGLVLWHPKGALVRELVENFWREEHRKRGYDIVYSPHIAKLDLWKVSGHWDWYKDSMYSPIAIDETAYLLKPMNCPFHILMYQSEGRSYRELPLRWAELGTVYRYERSGVLHGMLRVRGFTQDDAHLFCRPDQLEDEIVGVIELAQYMITSFGYKDYTMMLSVRDPENKQKYIGDDDVWDMAESALVSALRRRELDYVVGEGEAKFYGPAIDIMLKDELGRGWQGPTIQVDFNLPERFDITYTGEDGQRHRPVMIHRTVLGSMERFVGGLIEHYAGAFPTWLAPCQVKVIPITDKQHEYARQVEQQLLRARLRVELDARSEKVGYKIREAEVEKVPYMLVLGAKEAEAGTVSVRKRGKGDLGSADLCTLITDLKREVENRTIESR